jgi:hypothetical protein
MMMMMMMRTKTNRCYYVVSAFFLACIGRLYLWPREVLARVTPRRRMPNNIFNGTSSFAVGAFDEAGLLPAWATIEEADLKASKHQSRVGSSPLNKQVFQQYAAAAAAVGQPPLRIPPEYEPVSTGASI